MLIIDLHITCFKASLEKDFFNNSMYELKDPLEISVLPNLAIGMFVIVNKEQKKTPWLSNKYFL